MEKVRIGIVGYGNLGRVWNFIKKVYRYGVNRGVHQKTA